MKFTQENLTDFHRTLHKCCGLDPIRPSFADINQWRDFLTVMEPLEDTDGGPFCVADIVAMTSLMRKQNDRGGANWSLRPAKILRDPESMRDLILMARKFFRQRKRPPSERREIRAGKVASMIDHEPAGEMVSKEALSDSLAEFRKNMKGGRDA